MVKLCSRSALEEDGEARKSVIDNKMKANKEGLVRNVVNWPTPSRCAIEQEIGPRYGRTAIIIAQG